MSTQSQSVAGQMTAQIAGTTVRVAVRPGFPGAESISPTIELLVEGVLESPPRAPAQIAIYGCGHAAIAAVLAQRLPYAQLTLLDQSALALRAASATLTINQLKQSRVELGISLLPDNAATYDVVLIDLPQSRALARRWLVEAQLLLRDGGVLFLAGPNELGIQSVIDDAAALFGSVALVTYRRKCRIVRATRTSTPALGPRWAQEPGIVPGSWHALDLLLAGRSSPLVSLPGVFAYEGLDAGTALLLASMPDPRGLRVLDIGCGYGAIGVAAGLRGAAHVDLVDANTLAVAAARENLVRLGIAGEALAGDALEPVRERRYDLILSNPPFHAGKAIQYDMAEAFVRQGRAALLAGGQMVLVANRFIRYDRLLQAAFGNCTTLADNGRYWVLSASA